MAGGDAQHSRHQRREREISPSSVAQFQLLWKHSGGATLSAPVILGRLITYRGSVELIFVVSAKGEVWAIDGDFGRVFWRRQLEVAVHRCADALPPAPAFAPSGLSEEAEDDDGPQALRPLYVLTLDGRLHTLNPQDGRDVAPAREFVSGAWRMGDLSLSEGRVSTQARACGGTTNATWWMDVDAGSPSRRARTVRVSRPAPVVTGGVSFQAAGGSLLAFDGGTGKALYKGVPVPVGKTTELAAANGHVCFSRASTLYCYGLPVDQ